MSYHMSFCPACTQNTYTYELTLSTLLLPPSFLFMSYTLSPSADLRRTHSLEYQARGDPTQMSNSFPFIAGLDHQALLNALQAAKDANTGQGAGPSAQGLPESDSTVRQCE